MQDRKLAAIMFADIVSYSRLMGANESEALKLLNDFEEISAKIVKDFSGTIIKKNGDQIFCEFSSAKNAVDASLELQDKLSKYNDSRPKDFKLEVRIGIHIGDIVKKDNDIFGDGVNVAARIQPLASPGGICVSGAVSESLSSHPNYDIISKGEQELKNIIQKHSIFQIKTGYETIESEGSTPIHTKTKNNYTLYIVVGIVAIIAFLSIYNNSPIEEENMSIMLSSISSEENLKDIVIKVYETIEFKEVPDDITLEVLDKSKLDEIYGEFISYSEKHQFSNHMEIKSNFMIDEQYKREGKATPKFNLDAVRRLFGALFGLTDDDLGQSLGLLTSDSQSIGNYTKNISMSDFGYFPVIFRINSPQYLHYNDYFIWNVILYNYDESRKVQGEVHITTDNKIVESMYSALNYKVNTMLASSYGIISSIDQKNVILKFNPNDSASLKERMIYPVSRTYELSCNVCNEDLDSLVNKRINELTDYKLKIDNDKNSVFYKRFYEANEMFNSQKELDELNLGDHILHSMFGKEGNSIITISDVSKIKITEVFDSTATAIIYKPRNPYTELNIGDHIVY